MKVNAFSNGQYYPMILGSGRDGVLIDYVGSNFLSLNPHTHNVPHEGSPCGWYKMANLTKEDTQYPVIMAGIQIIEFGAPCEPVFYEQEFLPQSATLVTILDFRFGLKLKITSFLTKESIWCERAEVLECPENMDYHFAFRINEPFFASGCYYGDFEYPREVDFFADGDVITFNYKIGNHSGRGALVCNKPFEKSVLREQREWNDPKNIEGHLGEIKKGDVFERALICLGDNENHITFEELLEKAKTGVSALEGEHKAEWEEYFATSGITILDKRLQYVYDVSRYIAKAYQHPDTGLIALGMLPNHWKGGVWCSWDAEFAHEAMLSCGNFKESSLYADSYVKTAPENYAAVKSCGYPGVAFSGWTTVGGEFIGHTSLEEWLVNFKPSFGAYAVFAIYNEWNINPSAITDKHKKIAEDVLEFWLARIVREKDGLYYVIDIKDTTETGLNVALDSKFQATVAKSFLYVAQMTGNNKYKEIGEKMFEALEENRGEDGVIADWTGAPYHDFLIWSYLFLSEDNFIDAKGIEELMESIKTPWGYDVNSAVEEYRHWPWYNAVATLNYILSKNPEKAMENFKKLTYATSPLGAFPEKIRLDGYKINHWYESPHALCVLAANASFAHSAKKNEILLLYGFTPDYGNVECRDLCVGGGFALSVKTCGNEIVFLEIKNYTDNAQSIVLDINTEFELKDECKNITIKANSSFVFEK